MKVNKYTFIHRVDAIAKELKTSNRKLKKILTRYNIIKGGWANPEFELRGLVTNMYMGLQSTPEENWKKEVLFSEKGRKWVKQLFLLLDSDITNDGWVE